MNVGAGVDHGRDEPVQRCGVTGHRGGEFQTRAAAHHRNTVDTDVAADDHDVAGSGALRADVRPFVDEADTRRVDVDAVAMACVDGPWCRR